MSDFKIPETLNPGTSGPAKLALGSGTGPAVTFPFVPPKLRPQVDAVPDLIPVLTKVIPTPAPTPVRGFVTPSQLANQMSLPGLPVVTPTVPGAGQSETSTPVLETIVARRRSRRHTDGQVLVPDPEYGFADQASAEEGARPPQVPKLFTFPFPRTGDNLQIGDIVKRIDGSSLRHGFQQYPFVIVISLAPFIVASGDAEARWSVTVRAEDFISEGRAKEELMHNALTRLVK